MVKRGKKMVKRGKKMVKGGGELVRSRKGDITRRKRYTVNLGLVRMNYIFRERNLIYLHGEDKVRS